MHIAWMTSCCFAADCLSRAKEQAVVTRGVGPAGFFHSMKRFTKCVLCSPDAAFWCVDTAVGISVEFGGCWFAAQGLAVTVKAAVAQTLLVC